jgi:hypothetical protein
VRLQELLALLLCSDVQHLYAAQRNPRHKQSMCLLKKNK